MVALIGRPLGRLPILLAVLLAVVVIVTWVFELGPAVLIGAIGLVVLLLLVVAQGLFERSLQQGPAWSDDAQASREEATEVAADVADLRDRFERGELSEAEFESRVDDALSTGSLADAREVVQSHREGDFEDESGETGQE